MRDWSQIMRPMPAVSRRPTVAIVGCRGIPNRYGGFEQFAEELSVRLVRNGYAVFVYNVGHHPYADATLMGVKIVRKWCPEGLLGSAAHYIYDFLCLRDAVSRNVDIVLELGYGTSSISMRLCDRGRTKIVTNMDGLEWRREKFGRLTKMLIKWSERQGTLQSDEVVADNIGIKEYLDETYGQDCHFIPYGASVFSNPDAGALYSLGLEPQAYYLLIARLEPENKITMVLDGFLEAESRRRFIVVGGTDGKYGRWLKQKYARNNIKFLGGIYDRATLDNLRYFARTYFHGHSAGGTNPSLLEAMGAQCLIAAHMNEFNQSVLGPDALYFESKGDVSKMIDRNYPVETVRQFQENNRLKILTQYSWESIVHQYDRLFMKIMDADQVD